MPPRLEDNKIRVEQQDQLRGEGAMYFLQGRTNWKSRGLKSPINFRVKGDPFGIRFGLQLGGLI